jgi:hypothetical protein
VPNKTVTGGVLKRANEQDKYAVPVQTATGPSTGAGGNTPVIGSDWVFTTERVPSTPYTRGENVIYQDSNAHSTVTGTVAGVIGPAKYKITIATVG